ncbi:alpha/beta hydrolase [Geotoga petraea]|uniref:Alpha/beta hydrolase family protein n=1 Tax=Geotoga petraea TaxID=28234 RepID=A0A1G6KM18_9BACT|nr:alpha/beta hydrolase [Geotoga petraea]SDC32090.1 Alpha/beta hydrolase family protein [Geotoga petraea]
MIKKIILLTGAALGIGVLGFLIWAGNPLGPMEVVDEIINSSDIEVVEEKELYKIGEDNEVGLIYYPGARVDPKSYVPLAIEISKENITIFISKMSFNFAVFSPNKALEIVESNQDIDKWFIAGHSLGGAMAAKVVYENPGIFEGLILNASYPAENNSLKDKNVRVLSIYAEYDGLATVEKIDNSKDFLPEDTKYVFVEGGNHAQFGYYGPQNGDLEADISREEQRDIIAREMINFIK